MVSSGHLDFVNGGWSNNDETCPSFENTLTNFMKGHSWLAAEFGIRPKIGWVKGSIDHSAGYARLQADLGLHTLIYSKMSEQEINRRIAE